MGARRCGFGSKQVPLREFSIPLILLALVIPHAAEAQTVTATLAAGTTPFSMAVNPATNKVYVVNNISNNVTVIDGATNATTTVGVGTNPVAVAVNPVTDKIYVVNFNSNNITVIDGATNATTTLADPGAVGPVRVAVNPVTNKFYVTNVCCSTVTVIDGSTNMTTTVTSGIYPYALAVNPVTNKIYVANFDTNNVTVIDGASDSTTTTSAGGGPRALAVNRTTNKIYVANFSSNNVTVIDEQEVQLIPLQAAITPLAGNVTGSAPPTFDFKASSSFSPTAPTPDNLLFQVDTWQGPWQAATNQGSGSFSGTTPALQFGFHILYAYSTDGQEATSTNTGPQSSPLISNITAYGFLVAPPVPVISLSSASLTFAGEGVGTTSAQQTITLTMRFTCGTIAASP
jgi:YVTN family beta-propeller protein